MSMGDSDGSDKLWQPKYVLCLWLSIIILIPFDLNTVDSNGNMLDSIINKIVKPFLDNPGKTRDGAAVLIAKLLKRPDLNKTNFMKDYFNWCINIFKAKNSRDNTFLVKFACYLHLFPFFFVFCFVCIFVLSKSLHKEFCLELFCFGTYFLFCC